MLDILEADNLLQDTGVSYPISVIFSFPSYQLLLSKQIYHYPTNHNLLLFANICRNKQPVTIYILSIVFL